MPLSFDQIVRRNVRQTVNVSLRTLIMEVVIVATTRGRRQGSQDVPFHFIFKSAVGLALVALVAIGVLEAVTDYRASDLFQVIVILIGAAAGVLGARFLHEFYSIPRE